MKMTFIGATHEVTGSCTYLEAAGKRILVDFGMEQGRDTYENIRIPCAPAQIDYVLLTHAHIDHSGLLPLLYAGGFTGEIHATSASCSLCEIMLRDSAHIQEFEAEWRNRKAMRKGGDPYVPLYTTEEALETLKLFVPHPYDQRFSLCDGVEVRFRDAGHLLGSSSIELWLTEGETTKKLVFSGDIGNYNQPLIRDPQVPEEADYVIMESTYGNRLHEKPKGYLPALVQILRDTFSRKGSVIIPSFAVGRTQEMLYFIRKIKEDKLIHGHDNFEVYVDSPLAIEATRIFMEQMEDFDEDALDLVNRGINPIGFPGLKTAVTGDESKMINFDEKPKVIISASGMCDAGRIKHHLKHNLWRKESTILFVGYQSNGTLGRALVEGAKHVKLFGEEIEVQAEIHILAGISGHADKDGLYRWIASFEKKPDKVFVNHGDDDACVAFASRIRAELGLDADAPYSGTIYDLAQNHYIKATTGILIPKKEYAPGSRKNTVYDRLLAAGQRLLAVIRRNEGGANKDLAKFADQIDALCDKWER